MSEETSNSAVLEEVASIGVEAHETSAGDAASRASAGVSHDAAAPPPTTASDDAGQVESITSIHNDNSDVHSSDASQAHGSNEQRSAPDESSATEPIAEQLVGGDADEQPSTTPATHHVDYGAPVSPPSSSFEPNEPAAAHDARHSETNDNDSPLARSPSPADDNNNNNNNTNNNNNDNDNNIVDNGGIEDYDYQNASQQRESDEARADEQSKRARSRSRTRSVSRRRSRSPSPAERERAYERELERKRKLRAAKTGFSDAPPPGGALLATPGIPQHQYQREYRSGRSVSPSRRARERDPRPAAARTSVVARPLAAAAVAAAANHTCRASRANAGGGAPPMRGRAVAAPYGAAGRARPPSFDSRACSSRRASPLSLSLSRAHRLLVGRGRADDAPVRPPEGAARPSRTLFARNVAYDTNPAEFIGLFEVRSRCCCFACARA
jgi:hypothetical protein